MKMSGLILAAAAALAVAGCAAPLGRPLAGYVPPGCVEPPPPLPGVHPQQWRLNGYPAPPRAC